jgi:hypothetical protein
MLKRVVSDESGRILVWTLVILGVGVWLIPPLLASISTNLFASRTIEEGLKEQYAADAGVEYALYRLVNDDDVPFDNEPIPTAVNNMPVTVTVETVESEGVCYMITSTARDTVICAYVEYSSGGNKDLYKGALVSSGDIDLAKDCTVDGDIRYGGTFDPGSGFTHLSGDEIPGEIEFPPSEEFAQRYKDEALVGGTHEGDMNICSQPLGPKYITGDLNVGMNCVVTLEGTIYVDGMIDVGKDGEFSGVGSIVAEGDIYLAKVSDFGTDGGSVIMSVYGNITFKKDAVVEALIYAPGPAPKGQIKFDKEGTVTGGVVGANIQADKLNLFAYDASFYDGFELPGYQDPGFTVKTYNINP